MGSVWVTGEIKKVSEWRGELRGVVVVVASARGEDEETRLWIDCSFLPAPDVAIVRNAARNNLTIRAKCGVRWVKLTEKDFKLELVAKRVDVSQQR